jgi:hypothetical protein
MKSSEGQGSRDDVSPSLVVEEASGLRLPPELEPIAAAWTGHGLGALDAKSVKALENRLAEGATLEQLAAAVEGANVDVWLRRGGARSPFAVVFANRASLERRAHEGRKVLDARAAATRHEAEERRRDREWRELQKARWRDERPPTAAELRQSMPEHVPVRLPEPMTASELAQRRREQLALAEAWARENGEASADGSP